MLFKSLRHLPLLSLASAIVAGAAHGETPAANPMRGKLLFLRCASCHAIAESASIKVGPNLHGVIGRKAGSLPGYAYSPAMKATAFSWTPVMLDKWLTRPNALVPGTSMAFEGMASEADRQALIAYLAKPGA